MTATKRVEAFFYGIYMDAELLRGLGVNPLEPRIAELPGHSLDLRGSVKVAADPGKSVWGVAVGLTPDELETLYSSPATRAYRPMDVEVRTESGLRVRAGCYNQPPTPELPFNEEYRKKLVATCRKVGLPEHYAAALESMSG